MTRLPQGGLIDRATRLRFTFDGQPMTGHPGDTLASALLANGQHLVARSLKYHRPRGILSAGLEEPCALVTLTDQTGSTPNLKATEIVLRDGLAITSQNNWPRLSRDAGAVLQLGGKHPCCRVLLQDLQMAAPRLAQALFRSHSPPCRAWQDRP